MHNAFAAAIKDSPALEIAGPVELSAVCFRHRVKEDASEDARNLFNLALLKRIVSRGKVYLSNAELKEKFSLADDSKGVVVVDVVKDSPAAEKGLKAGDVIIEAAQEEIKSATQVAGKVDDAKRAGRKSILLLVERQGDLRFIALRLDQS